MIEFINTIKKNVPASDLTLFYNNFNDVNTMIKDFKVLNLVCGGHVAARWVPKSKTIELSPDNYQLTINHELFHVSSTYKDLEKNMYFSGFQQFKSSDKQIGEGLNEGYTQYLAEKYFSHEPILKAYSYEKRIAEAVELITGDEKMKSLYFNADLKGLIDVLKQYNSEENIYDFIRTLDFLNKHMYDKKLTHNSSLIKIGCVKSINSFLIQTYVKKLILEYPGLRVDVNEIFDRLSPLLIKIPSEVKVNGKATALFDDEIFREILGDAFSGYELNEDGKTIVK